MLGSFRPAAVPLRESKQHRESRSEMLHLKYGERNVHL